jgi:hypothetical protein
MWGGDQLDGRWNRSVQGIRPKRWPLSASDLRSETVTLTNPIRTLQIGTTHRFSSPSPPRRRDGRPGRAHCWDPDPKLGRGGATPCCQMIEGSGLLVSGCQEGGSERSARRQSPGWRTPCWRGLMGANESNPLIDGPYDDPGSTSSPAAIASPMNAGPAGDVPGPSSLYYRGRSHALQPVRVRWQRD